MERVNLSSICLAKLFASNPNANVLDVAAKHQAQVVQNVNNAIRLINRYPVDRMVCSVNTYPLDSDLSGG